MPEQIFVWLRKNHRQSFRIVEDFNTGQAESGPAKPCPFLASPACARGTELIGYLSSTGESVYYRSNVHGDVKELTNALGEVLTRYTYDAYGQEEAAEENPFRFMFQAEKVHNPFRYTGEYTDEETGYIYLRARMYDPSVGRFISEDPIKSGLNWYIYAGNNPIAFIDPLGLDEVGIRDWVESQGGVVNPVKNHFLFLSWGLKQIDVTLNGITKTYTSADYKIKGNRAYIDDSILTRDFTSLDDSILFEDFAPTAPSDAAISFIAEYESFSAMPYRGQDSQNRTVGYGHVITEEDGKKYDNGISQSDALALLRSDAQGFTNQLNVFLVNNTILLTQNQYDALLSFTFNCGDSWLKDSTLRNVLISGDINKVGDAMMMWVNVNGQKSQGLVNRRTDEVEMFYSADYKRNH